MAPEQIQGKPRAASDQYSLGVVIYEWLSGARPFEGATAIEIAMHHLTDPPPPLREKLPTIAAEVEQVVMTALAKDPKQRFASVLAFATALEQASQSGQNQPSLSSRGATPSSQLLPPTVLATLPNRIPELTTEAPPPSHSSHVLEIPDNQAKIRPSRRTVIAGLAGLALVGDGITWFATSRSSTSKPILGTIPTSLSTTPTPLPIGTTLSTYYKGHSYSVNSVAWSPNGKRVASGSADETVQIWDATDGSNVYTYKGHSSNIRSVAWSSAGKRIASASTDQTVQVWDATDGSNVFTYKGHSSYVYSVA